ncbi:protein of unknown function [Candidatus Promineifilum breve]|uniref:Uncharacterized protein n=1 Tax=Candidatus Promineifilum breve TaxID=1806508 RepID=A0A160T7R0_9CHLR|nr:protein of unknown function [Candidatus Promineifilum breve]
MQNLLVSPLPRPLGSRLKKGEAAARQDALFQPTPIAAASPLRRINMIISNNPPRPGDE